MGAKRNDVVASVATRWVPAIPVVLAVAVGCGSSGSSGPSGSSSTPDPGSLQTAQGFCAGAPTLSGGDLVGTWTIVGVCGISTGSPDNCADAKVTLSLSTQGTITFNADQTGSIDATTTITRHSVLPASCSTGGSCASFQSDLSGGVITATCTPSPTDASMCTCEEDFAPYRMQGSGTYMFERPDYLYSHALSLQGGFLVQGDTLRLDGPGYATTAFDLIAQR